MDQTDIREIPYRLSNKGVSFNTTTDICRDDLEITQGQVLASFDLMSDQISCRPNVYNAGNYYSWGAATANNTIADGNAPDSVCPKGWILPTGVAEVKQSFQYLMNTIYDTKEALELPFSYVLTGKYSGLNVENIFYERGTKGYFSSSFARSTHLGKDSSYFLSISKNSLSSNASQYMSRHTGYSLRCVATATLHLRKSPN